MSRSKEIRDAFALMVQEQEEDRRFHEMLVAEVAYHPERSIQENLKAVHRRHWNLVKAQRAQEAQ